ERDQGRAGRGGGEHARLEREGRREQRAPGDRRLLARVDVLGRRLLRRRGDRRRRRAGRRDRLGPGGGVDPGRGHEHRGGGDGGDTADAGGPATPDAPREHARLAGGVERVAGVGGRRLLGHVLAQDRLEVAHRTLLLTGTAGRGDSAG